MKFKKLVIVVLLISTFIPSFVYADDYQDCLNQCDKNYDLGKIGCGIGGILGTAKFHGDAGLQVQNSCEEKNEVDRDRCYYRCVIKYR